jgi:hypothetical protein
MMTKCGKNAVWYEFVKDRGTKGIQKGGDELRWEIDQFQFISTAFYTKHV